MRAFCQLLSKAIPIMHSGTWEITTEWVQGMGLSYNSNLLLAPISLCSDWKQIGSSRVASVHIMLEKCDYFSWWTPWWTVRAPFGRASRKIGSTEFLAVSWILPQSAWSPLHSGLSVWELVQVWEFVEWPWQSFVVIQSRLFIRTIEFSYLFPSWDTIINQPTPKSPSSPTILITTYTLLH